MSSSWREEIGSRFWPASRADKPKQFLDMLGLGKSLLRLTYERFLHVTDTDKIFVLTNEQYRPLVSADLPELAPHQILGEPSRNNTAPCVAYAAFKLGDLDPQANLVVAPSDHFIAQEHKFVEVIKDGLAFTAAGPRILTLGMKPHRPDTGYGYIEMGDQAPTVAAIYEAAAFREKPDSSTASSYLAAGNYVWNSGIFLFSVSTILQSFADHASEIHDILSPGCMGIFNTDKEEEFLRQAYPQTPSISIDYAIMEKADNVYCFPADFGWSDLGTWGSLYDHLPKDQQGNVGINATMEVDQSRDNLVKGSSDRTFVLHQVSDLLVVEEEDLILVMPRAHEGAIKQLQKRIIQ